MWEGIIKSKVGKNEKKFKEKCKDLVDENGYQVAVIDLRNPTRSNGNNLLHLVNKYMDLCQQHPDTLVYKAKAEKYAKIISKTIILSGMDAASFGQNAYFYDADSFAAGRPIVNYGTLTITGNGTIDSSNAGIHGFGAVNNYGTLTIKNGTFRGALASNATNIWNREGGIAYIEGGTYDTSCTAISTAEGSITRISGGSYSSPWYPAPYGPQTR